MNLENCLKWRRHKTINPITGRKIKKNGETYNKFKKLCKKYETQTSIINKYRQHGLFPYLKKGQTGGGFIKLPKGSAKPIQFDEFDIKLPEDYPKNTLKLTPIPKKISWFIDPTNTSAKMEENIATNHCTLKFVKFDNFFKKLKLRLQRYCDTIKNTDKPVDKAKLKEAILKHHRVNPDDGFIHAANVDKNIIIQMLNPDTDHRDFNFSSFLDTQKYMEDFLADRWKVTFFEGGIIGSARGIGTQRTFLQMLANSFSKNEFFRKLDNGKLFVSNNISNTIKKKMEEYTDVDEELVYHFYKHIGALIAILVMKNVSPKLQFNSTILTLLTKNYKYISPDFFIFLHMLEDPEDKTKAMFETNTLNYLGSDYFQPAFNDYRKLLKKDKQITKENLHEYYQMFSKYVLTRAITKKDDTESNYTFEALMGLVAGFNYILPQKIMKKYDVSMFYLDTILSGSSYTEEEIKLFVDTQVIFSGNTDDKYKTYFAKAIQKPYSNEELKEILKKNTKI